MILRKISKNFKFFAKKSKKIKKNLQFQNYYANIILVKYKKVKMR